MNVEVKYFLIVEILLEEGKIKVYDCNLPFFDDGIFFTHTQPLLELFPILLRKSKKMDRLPTEVLMKQPWDFKGQNQGMECPKFEIIATCGSHTLAHIKGLLIGTQTAKPMTFLYINDLENMQEVWSYGVLSGCLEPVYKEELMK